MSSNKPVFVDGMNPHGPIQDGHHSRLYHKKSRTGCQRCRLRRVKCNEAKPTCRHCERHGVCCIYDRLDPATKHSTESRSVDTPQSYVPVAEPTVSPLHRQNFRVEASSPSLDANYAHNHGLVLADSPDEPVESRRRRMVELELMHFYITETGPSIAFDKNSSYDLFVKAIPRAAIKSDSLLYSMYAIAALHQTKTTGGQGPSIPSPTAVAMARENHQIYSQLAFQHHHQDLAQISHANVDMLIMTASIMRLIAFVVLSERPLVPYMAPLHWLTITKSHAQVFLAAWDLVGDNSSTQTARLIKSTPVVWDYDERQGADKREGLEHLLQPVPGIDERDEDHPSLWDDGVRRAYESTLSYIGGIWQSVQRNDPLGPIARRLILFPILVEQRFIDLVGEAKPRALVILAHYFALVTILKSFWFVGNTGPREVRSIAAYLPAHWQGNMELPLRLVNEGLPYSQAAAS